jgi:hypothetical protein
VEVAGEDSYHRAGPFEAEESIACDGSEGRVIGKGGETIRRLQEETGCRIDIEKGSGTCVVKGTAAAVRLGVAVVRRQIEEGDGGPGGFKRKRESEDEPIDSAAMYGQGARGARGGRRAEAAAD